MKSKKSFGKKSSNKKTITKTKTKNSSTKKVDKSKTTKLVNKKSSPKLLKTTSSKKPLKSMVKPIKNNKNSVKTKEKKSVDKNSITKSVKQNLPKKLTKTSSKIKAINVKDKDLNVAKNTKNTKSKKTNGINKIEKSDSLTINSFVVYPSHGVGKIIDIENTQVMQQSVSCYLIYFDREKLTIKIPVKNADKFGIRKLASKSQMDEVFAILRSGVKKMKGMWSRRAQEYETKINSGDIIMLAEVIRDLTRDIEDSERSYSERIIYETAIFRLACEYSAIYNIPIEDAKNKVTMTAKDKLESDARSSSRGDDFDDFDNIKKPNLDKDDEEEDEDEEEEEEEDDDFNYEYNEDAEDDDFEDDEKPNKKKR